jgi:hypothetical protein
VGSNPSVVASIVPQSVVATEDKSDLSKWKVHTVMGYCLLNSDRYSYQSANF